ncbi:MAG: NAD(P)/FAD-dependent oxidoreductase [Solirubrobacterales bacterium]|nr:NAD(P)/FAD-dependent oxidoreductase [Solirubrobacterales bacterium]
MSTSTSSQRIVVLGSSFAGLTAALEVRKHLDDGHEVVVIDPRDHFTFIPSLIWLPFGKRKAADVTFPLAPLYERKGIRYVEAAAASVDVSAHRVATTTGEVIDYDKLLVATGPRLAFEKVPGLGPDGGHTQSVCNLEHAEAAAAAWDRFLENPGPVVVGTAQGGSCFGASYEFLFNVHHRIRKAGLQDVAPVKFVTAEPFLGHFGLGGVGDSAKQVEKFLDRLGIEGIPNSSITEARDGTLVLDGGRELEFAFSMIVPPFTGVDAIRESDGLANPMGFVPIDERFRHPDHPDVYAAGVATAIAPPEDTEVPAGVPKTGQMSETMAKVAAENIVADVTGKGDHREMPISELSAICVLDAGNNGIIFKADNVLAHGRYADDATPSARVMAGPQAHWAKLAFERYFMSSRKRGMVAL